MTAGHGAKGTGAEWEVAGRRVAGGGDGGRS